MNFGMVTLNQCLIKMELCDIGRDSFIIHVKTDDTYKEIAKDVEKWFDTSNYEIDRPLPKKIKK